MKIHIGSRSLASKRTHLLVMVLFVVFLLQIAFAAPAPVVKPKPVVTALPDATLTDVPYGATNAKIQLASKPAGATFTIDKSPTHGRATAPDDSGMVFYTPIAGFSGADSFTFFAHYKGTQSKSAATQEITVLPQAADGKLLAVQASHSSGKLAGNGSNLVFGPASQDTGHATVTVTPASGDFVYAPDSATYAGTDSFKFTVQDSTTKKTASGTETVIVADCISGNPQLLGLPYATTAAAPAGATSGMTTAAMIAAYKATPQSFQDCLAYFRVALGERALEEHERLIQLKQLDLALAPSEHQNLYVQVKNLQTDVDALAAAGFTPETMPKYIENYDDYPALYYTFFAGAEYRNVNGIFNNGYPDVGLFLYERPRNREGWSRLIPDGYTVISLASSSEQHIGAPSGGTVSAPSGGTISAPSLGTGARALQADLKVFWPLAWPIDLSPNSNYVGPMVDIGVRKTDTVQQFDRRVYYGIRAAISQEMYVELLYGHTASLNTHRFEIRAQMPVYDFHNSTKLYIGADANLSHGHPDDPKVTADPDTFVIYLIWNVPLSTVLGAAGGSSSP